MQTVKFIEFTPCTGFGAVGRSANLLDGFGGSIGIGYGATDNEAVLEALMASGLSYDHAFDLVGETIKQSQVSREEAEFPMGEFPL
jgi:hypothetical protein